jgi:hypothetical protein
MDPEVDERCKKIEGTLQTTEKQLADRSREVKTALLKSPAGATSALWVRLKLLDDRNKSSENPDHYDIVIEGSPATDGHWKLDVNDRYQKAVGTVVTLATLALGGPFIFLKNLTGKSLLSVFTPTAVLGEGLLGLSIVCAVAYYFFSAKWVKLALLGKADFFKITMKDWFVEFALDASYFLMMIGFLAGVFFVVEFMTTYVPS